MWLALSIFALLVMWLAQPTGSAQAQGAGASLAVVIVVDGGVTTVPSGQPFTYRIQYRCASIVTSCLNAQITDVLPAALSGLPADVQMGTSSHIASISYDQTSRTARWTFVNPLPAGSAGEVLISVLFPNGTTPNGTTVTNTVTMSAGNAPSVTATASPVIATARFDMTVTKVQLSSGIALDQDVPYRLDICNPGGPPLGRLDLENVTVSDTLHPGAVFVSASDGGVYNPATRTVTWTIARVLSTPYSCVSRYVTIRFPSASFQIGNVITNTMPVRGTPPGQPTVILTATSAASVIAPGAPALNFSKTADVPRTAIGGSFAFRIAFSNQGNVSFQNVVITDTIPPQYRLEAIDIGTNNLPAGSIPVSVQYQTNLNANWTNLPGSPFSTPPARIVPVSSLGLAANEVVVAVRWVYGSLPPGFALGPDQLNGLLGTVTNPDRNGNPVNNGDVVENCADIRYTYSGTSNTSRSCAGVAVGETPPIPVVSKLATAGDPAVPGGLVTYRLWIINNGLNSEPLVNPVLADLLPASLEFVGWTPTLCGTSSYTLQRLDNYRGTGRTLLRIAYAGSVPAFTTCGGEIRVRVKPGTLPGVVLNTLQLIGYANPRIVTDNCHALLPDTNDLDGDGVFNEQFCSTEASITIRQSAQVDSVKWVKGQLDNDYSRYPESGLTVPGGTIDYRLIVSNTGNASLAHLTVIDVLPAVGDQGVIDLQPRLSQWTPLLVGPVVPSDPRITVQYSTASNPCRDELRLPSDPVPFPTGCTPPNWTAALPSDPTTVHAIRLDFGAIILAPGTQYQFDWRMVAPVNGPVGEIAWNSFGFVVSRADDGEQLLPTEPIKVGIQLQPGINSALGNYVWIDTNRDGVQNEPAANGVNGVRAYLYRPGPDGLPGTVDDVLLGQTVTGNDAGNQPGYYLFPNLDAGTYFVRFDLNTLPLGYAVTIQNAGGNDNTDSDASPTTGRTILINLGAGVTDLRWDMGIYQGQAPLNDLGDLPSPTYPTLLANNGPRHTVVQGVCLGSVVDAEPDGQPNITALGDDQVGIPDDEDGVTFLTPLVPGAPARIQVVACSAGYLNAWIDFNSNGSLADASDRIALDRPLAAGANLITITVPANAAGVQYSRFRFTSGQGQVTAPTGAAPNGEVEDYVLAALGDYVWVDTNRDGLQNDGNTGVNGVSVRLLNCSNAPIRDANGNPITTVTANHPTTGQPGWYQFPGLPPNCYVVQFIRPAGYDFTLPHRGTDEAIDSDADQISGLALPVTLVAAEINPNVDAGLIPAAAIGDRVWYDTNANGIQDTGETGVSGVTVRLHASVGTVVSTTTTNAAGYYHFTGLIPGDYYVCFVPPTGYTISPQNQGTNNAVDSDANPATGCTVTTSLSPGEDDLTWDMGIYSSAGPRYDLGDLPDTPYPTLLANGPRHVIVTGVCLGSSVDAEPNGQPSVTALGDDQAGIPDDEDGVTFLTPLVPGAPARIQVVACSAGYLNAWIDFNSNGSLADASDRIAADRPLAAGANLITITVPANAAGVQYSRFRFTSGQGQATAPTGAAPNGEVEDYVLAALGDYVWVDANRNGLQDDDNTGVNGVSIRLLNCSNTPIRDANGNPVTTVTANHPTTGRPGWYQFPGLPPSCYGVQFVRPAGYTFTYPHLGTDEATDSDPDQDTGLVPALTLVAAQNNLDVDAGLIRPSNVVVHKEAQTSHVDGILGADRLITYTLVVTNTGSDQLVNLTLADTLPGGTACFACSPTSQVTDGISTTLLWAIPQLDIQRAFRVTFVVSVTSYTSGSFSIENQASVRGGLLTDTVRSNRVNTPFDPNAVDLTDFSVTPSLNPVTSRPTLVVRWTTGAEIDTYGFHLLRSTDGSRDNAVRVTPGTILRQGQGTLGASYEWVDDDVQPGVTYTYWLQETELSGTVNVYPLTSGRIGPDWRLRRYFMPVIRLER